MVAAGQLGPDTGIRQACDALGVPRASFYRRRTALAVGQAAKDPASSRRSPRALGPAERRQVKETLYSERFADQAPREVYATLLDEGEYLCSVRTMYRILDEDQAANERRNQLRHPEYKKPELLATGPNQVWSWDITKLLGPQKWTYYYLYVILDVFSRYVVGWMLAHRESSDLASRLIRESLDKQGVSEDQLTLHSDRGPSMTSHNVAQLLATLGVTKSHSRPHVSNDNPFSESQFKTLKYRGDFPDRFDSHEHGLSFCREFFPWYNDEHYHSGIGLLTPAMLHYGQAPQVIASRVAVLQQAFAKHPERFVRGCPRPQSLPDAVWINPPARVEAENKKGLPAAHCPRKPDAPLTHPRPGYPSPSCVPAELDSVSPGTGEDTRSVLRSQLLGAVISPLNTRAMPEKIPGGLGDWSPKEADRSRTTEGALH
jgi:putative transposase